MILAMDIGNSDIKLGAFQKNLAAHLRIPTHKQESTSYYYQALSQALMQMKLHEKVSKALVSSVVPAINDAVGQALVQLKITPSFLSYEMDTGLAISYQPPESLGTDRIANAVGAVEMFGAPVITVDFGTATTFGAVNAQKVFCGGAIAPGMKTAASALVDRAHQLQEFSWEIPQKAIADNTIEGLQAGIIYGYAGLADGLIERMQQELPGAKVVATGGLCTKMAEVCHRIDAVEPMLTLQGIHEIFLRNKG